MTVQIQLSDEVKNQVKHIIMLANDKGIINCDTVTVLHAEPGIMYTLDCECGRIKAIRVGSNILDWSIREMK